MLTPLECQAARGRLQWTRETLAREAGVAVSAVIAFELEQGPADASLVAALTGALEAAETVLPVHRARDCGRAPPHGT
jgi:hypothetical protein